MRFQVNSTVFSSDFLEEGFELGEEILNGNEVRAVGRQEQNLCTGGADGTGDQFRFGTVRFSLHRSALIVRKSANFSDRWDL